MASKSRILRPAVPHLRLTAALALNIILITAMKSSGARFDACGIQFIPFNSFSAFTKLRDPTTGATILTSPEIQTRIRWDELIASWNAGRSAAAHLKIEVRAVYPDRATKWFIMGLWSTDPAVNLRESVRGQQDHDGKVNTDTLVLKQPAERVQLRVTLSGGRQPAKLKFLSLSVLDSKVCA